MCSLFSEAESTVVDVVLVGPSIGTWQFMPCHNLTINPFLFFYLPPPSCHTPSSHQMPSNFPSFPSHSHTFFSVFKSASSTCLLPDYLLCHTRDTVAASGLVCFCCLFLTSCLLLGRKHFSALFALSACGCCAHLPACLLISLGHFELLKFPFGPFLLVFTEYPLPEEPNPKFA